MSRELAPIHYWIFGKIMIMEEIELAIIDRLNNPSLKSYANELALHYGQYVCDSRLDLVVDHKDIMGWLNKRLASALTRQALIINEAITLYDKSHVMAVASQVYFEEGTDLGQYRSDIDMDTAPQIYKALSDVLYEGMPNEAFLLVTYSDATAIRWDVTQCVHQNFWNHAHLNVTDYYTLRQAFSRGFVEGINSDFTYAFILDPLLGQKHAIFRPGLA